MVATALLVHERLASPPELWLLSASLYAQNTTLGEASESLRLTTTFP